MSFDPGDHSVKNASKELDGMSLEDLESVLEMELDGKHRSSLIAEIGRSIDAIKTVAEAHVSEPAETVAEAPQKVAITSLQYHRLHRHMRKSWRKRSDGMFELG